MSPRVYRAADLHPAPWKNGGGLTREVARAPAAAGVTDFDWRISIADVTTPGRFSPFPGVDRVIVLIGGAGMTLQVDGHLHPLARYEPFAFRGEADTSCELPAGPTRDLNVMTRRHTAVAHVEARALNGTTTVDVPSADDLLIVVLTGIVEMNAGESIELGPLDTVHWTAAAPVELAGRGQLAIVALTTG